MSKIVRGGQSGSLDNINSSQGTFRTQISALTDAVRQLGGNPEIGAGAVVNDPLSAPYVLYVNPYTGKDTFVGGNYSTSGDATKRIELQRLECGYTEARPFKTINRAIIEAGIITAKSFYSSPLTNNDLVSIVLAPGAQTVLNGVGNSSVNEWAATKEPTDAELQAFNPSTTGGILLPRGCSLCGWDLRKTIIRPEAVPAVADEASDASNRRSIFKVTGTGYYFGFTFMDKAGSTASHHLLHCFEFASQSELDEFYTKIGQAFGGANNTGGLDNALAVTRSSEYEIVGPQPASGSQTINTDTTLSASPYIFNCSIRSNYGLSGVYADGAKTSGFRSMVIAQFTGVSLQRDLSCWQKYDIGASPKWGTTFANYADYISTDPDNVRMHPSRLSFHIRTVNDAIIQEVSVFAIGQGVHHWTQSGGEITITNSNSNFGGCAAISEGYKTAAFNADRNWVVNRLRVAANLSDLSNNVRKIFLGTISAVTSNSITLVNGLGESSTVSGVPDLLARDGYTFRAGSHIWVENPQGPDWRSTLTGSPWSVSTPAQINISTALTDENGQSVGTTDSGISNAISKRVYIRRLVDTRTPEQRRFTLKLNTTDANVRIPVRDYVLQLSTGTSVVNNPFPVSQAILVSAAGQTSSDSQGVRLATEVLLRRANASVNWTSGAYYKKGETVKRDDKHFTCIKDNTDSTFNVDNWQESYVHMVSSYNPEDFYKLDAPILTFDKDASGSENSTTLGYDLNTVWATDSAIQAQYHNASDYRGLHLFLTALGFSSANAHTILTPRAEASRDRDPSSSSDMGGYVPAGAANALGNWPVEFRRPSVIRLFGHAWEWTGYLNYTKAIPSYQKDLSPQNKFTYYFTNVDGGRVYATGFNEEGYQVSQRGLEDIVTGDTLSVEDLGSSDITLEPPTNLSNLTLNGTTTINDTLVVNATNVQFPSTLSATTTNIGLGEIASITELEATTFASTDEALNQAGSQFVTVAGLNYWKSHNRVLTQRELQTTLYVVPDNAVNGGTYNFNGTSAVLALDPNRSASAVEATPPTSRTLAVTLSRAVAYANTIFSNAETVNYQLANGPYYDAQSLTLNHIANILGATSAFPDANRVASFTSASTKPTTDVKAIHDARSPYLAPCFGVGINIFWTGASLYNSGYIDTRHYQLVFNFGGSVQGICWLSLQKTLNDTANFPNTLYSTNVHAYRTTNVSLQSCVDNALFNEVDAGVRMDKFWSNPLLSVKGNLTVKNCIFGARAPGFGFPGYGSIAPHIFVHGDATIVIGGIYFLGNSRITSLPQAVSKGITITGDMLGTKNCQYFIAGYGGNYNPAALEVYPKQFFYQTPNVTKIFTDYDVNCIHILDDNGNYGLLSNRAATDGSRGASFDGIIGYLNAGSSLQIGGYYSDFITANRHPGVAGAFGNNGDSSSGPTSVIALASPFACTSIAHNSVIWSQAITGATLTYNVGLVYAAGSSQLAYTNSSDNPLNLNTKIFYRGVDIDTANTVGGFVTSLGSINGVVRYGFFA